MTFWRYVQHTMEDCTVFSCGDSKWLWQEASVSTDLVVDLSEVMTHTGQTFAESGFILRHLDVNHARGVAEIHRLERTVGQNWKIFG